MSGGARVSIPGSVRKTIQNIKEIAGNHTDEEVYAMLKECAMDPNETAQKLLLLDTFHEVKRKRDKRKENRETVDSRGRLEPQGRGARGGRGIYSSRYVSYDSGGGSDVGVGKENSANQGADKHNRSPPSPATHDAENKSTVPMSSFVAGPANGFPNVEDAISGNRCASQVSDFTGNTVVEEWSAAKINKAETQPPGDVKRCSASGQFMPKSCQLSSSMTPKSVSGVYASALDTVLLPSLDACNPGAVGAIGHEVGSQRTSAGTSSSGVVSHESATSELSSVSEKSSIEAKNSYMQAKVQSKSQGFEIHQFSAQDASSTSLTAATGCRPSSVCKNRLQQLSGPPKAAGPTMEWKPKAASVNAAQCSEAQGMSETEPVSSETVASSPAASSSTYSEDTSLKLHKLLEPLHISDTQHVIIPNHLQVPESQRIGLTFGSFDANFGLSTAFATAPDSDESSTQLSESYQEVEENVEELSQRIPNASTTVQEAGYPDHLQPPARLPASVSAGEPIPAASENDQLKPEAAIALQGPPHSVIHAAPNLSTFGRVTQVLGSQFATTESTEPQPQDSLHLSSFLVQQQLDPSTSYYTQIYRPAADGDGRFSPFLLPSTPSKYNGNISVIPAQTSQCPQEIGNSPFPSSTVLAPLVTQAAGVMQTSFSVSQQSVPVYRQPAGVHMSHYPPNFIPYSQYFSPFFVPPPTIHHFLSNTGFPQQLPTRSIYPPPAAAAAVNPVKYSPTQYKPPTSNVNTTHLGMPAGFGTYNSTPTGYCPNPIVSSGNSTRNEDSASQYEENNVYATAQQNEAPAVWISAPGRDISSLQASSFYGLPPQGQQLTFAPAQAGHGAFTGIYHPNQSVAAGSVHPLLQQSQAMAGAVEVVGPPSGVYQQPQLPQELRQTSCSGIVLGRGPADLEFTQDPESLLMCPHCSLPESSANQNVWSCVVTKDNHVPILPLHPHPIS